MRLPISITFLVLSAVAHGSLARWVLSAFPRARQWRRWILAGVVVAAVVGGAARASNWRLHTPAGKTAAAMVLVEIVGLWLSLVPMMLIVPTLNAARHLVRRVGKGEDAAADAESDPGPSADDAAREHVATREPAENGAPEDASSTADIGRRQAVERLVGLASLGVTGTALGWGMFRGRHDFHVEEVIVRLEKWPRVLDGYVIAQVSDIHVGAFVGNRDLDAGFARVRELKPDLVVATGDLVDVEPTEVEPLIERLIKVDSRDGVVAILGNHDHYAGPMEIAESLRAAKIRFLSNDSIHLRRGDGGGFALLGVDDYSGRGGRVPGFIGPDLGLALKHVRGDVPRVLLAHQPKFLRHSAGRVDVQLSGHTHGGQINPGVCPVSLFMEFVEGRYERAGTTLWVNRGFGVSGAPTRVGAPPEITKIVLVSA